MLNITYALLLYNTELGAPDRHLNTRIQSIAGRIDVKVVMFAHFIWMISYTDRTRNDIKGISSTCKKEMQND